jgi:endo-1,4-beta-D-glucanase Y
MAAVAKKKPKNSMQAVAERKLAEFEAEFEKRGSWARKIYKAQDVKTKTAIDEIITALAAMADPERKLRVEFEREEIHLSVSEDVYENAWLWVAVRLCIVAHEWDIRVANFKPIRKGKP